MIRRIVILLVWVACAAAGWGWGTFIQRRAPDQLAACVTSVSVLRAQREAIIDASLRLATRLDDRTRELGLCQTELQAKPTPRRHR